MSPSPAPRRQPTWQRILLLIVLGYEVLGCLSGGGLLVAAPDGHLMDMQVEGMGGFFPDFFVPGLLLIGLGILNIAAFVAVWRRTRTDWLFSGLALGGLTVWFLVEIAVVGLHWLQAMWGLPVLLGVVMALPLIRSRAEGRPFIQSHPVLTYYILTFAISWGGMLLVIIGGRSSFPATPEQFERLIPTAILTLLAGPPVAWLLLTGLVDGRAGYGELRARLSGWRVGAGWYAVALLTAPVAFAAASLAMSLASPAYLPAILTRTDKAAVLLVSIAPALLVGFGEELGWTGFVVPRLLRRHGVLGTGLIAGFLWGVWHLPLLVWMTGDPSGAFSLPLFLPALLSAVGLLPAYRVLMVWVYDHTRSLPTAMLMHASNTASSFIVGTSATGLAASAHNLVVITALWACVAALAISNRRQLSRQPLGTQVA
jgi:membrane protease YdiL (CAAX protease family)